MCFLAADCWSAPLYRPVWQFADATQLSLGQSTGFDKHVLQELQLTNLSPQATCKQLVMQGTGLKAHAASMGAAPGKCQS